jgi:elongator complex protein 3
MKKLSRTVSGVTPVAVMTRPWGCPGKCVYCPSFGATPQSYTPESPAVIRARACDYDAQKQITTRIATLSGMGHPTDKIELIIMGGTFLATPVEYQYDFVKNCYDALNGIPSGSLVEAQSINEASSRRCVGLCIETRPDFCNEDDIKRMLDFGATRVELGVQLTDDTVYRKVNRGHTVAEVVNATRLLKSYGYKVYYHWMPGMPGSSPEKDLELSRQLFDKTEFKPDGLKLYPTMVVEGTTLEEWYKQGEYLPYEEEVMLKLIADIKAVVPPYVRISRVLRDIPSKYITAGLHDSIRQKVLNSMTSRNLKCKCIRCREYGHRLKAGWKIGAPALKRVDYVASDGHEVFLSLEDEQETLFGLLRLRIQNSSSGPCENASLVRELHVFGPELPFGERSEYAAQHHGLGKALLALAEQISFTEFGKDEILVLSGIGARAYYRDQGYHLKEGYMSKTLLSECKTYIDSASHSQYTLSGSSPPNQQ